MRKCEALALTKRLRIGSVWRNGEWQPRESRIRVDEWDTVVATIKFGDHVSEADAEWIMDAIKTTLERAR
jgi:hypothetical protein